MMNTRVEAGQRIDQKNCKIQPDSSSYNESSVDISRNSSKTGRVWLNHYDRQCDQDIQRFYNWRWGNIEYGRWRNQFDDAEGKNPGSLKRVLMCPCIVIWMVQYCPKNRRFIKIGYSLTESV